MYMGGFEVKIPDMGGWVYKCPGSSCVSTHLSSTPPRRTQNEPYVERCFFGTGVRGVVATQLFNLKKR